MALATPPNRCLLYRIPIEIRLRIYPLYNILRTGYDNSVPALLQAVENTILYNEVRELYDKINFTVTLDNQDAFRAERMKRLLEIEHVLIVAERDRGEFGNRICSAVTLHAHKVQLRNNFRSITVDFTHRSLFNYDISSEELPSGIWVRKPDIPAGSLRFAVDLFGASSNASLIRVRTPAVVLEDKELICGSRWLVWLGNGAFGVPARLERVTTDAAIECWIWEADNGGPLLKQKIEALKRQGIDPVKHWRTFQTRGETQPTNGVRVPPIHWTGMAYKQ